MGLYLGKEKISNISTGMPETSKPCKITITCPYISSYSVKCCYISQDGTFVDNESITSSPAEIQTIQNSIVVLSNPEFEYTNEVNVKIYSHSYASIIIPTDSECSFSMQGE